MAAAHAEAGFLGRIIKSADKQWTAAAWILERRFPERWKRRDDLDVSAKIKGNVSMSGPEAPRGEALASYLEQLSQMPSTIRSRLDKK